MFRLFVLVVSIFLSISVAEAHFLNDARTRIVHISESDEGTRLLIRIPGPIAYAQALAARTGPTDIVDAPFLKRTYSQGVPFYLLDAEAIESDAKGFAAFLASGYEVQSKGQILKGVPGRVGYTSSEQRQHFSTLQEAEEAFEYFAGNKSEWRQQEIFISDAVLDLELKLPGVAAGDTVTLRSVLPEIRLPVGTVLENILMDHRGMRSVTKIQTGQLVEPVQLSGSRLHGLASFIWQGMVHIAIGLDHVLFVVCLALASGFSRGILWSVTGLTLGHSVTLYMGSIGLAPQGDWFPPTVEFVIALSILLAAFLAINQQRPSTTGTRSKGPVLFAITAMIGLLHGYGFSFVFGELMNGDASRQVLALLGFNIGVELGQMVIVLLVLAGLWAAGLIGQIWPKRLNYAGLAIACLFAGIWTIERAGLVAEMVWAKAI